jgi:hypothetical protein
MSEPITIRLRSIGNSLGFIIPRPQLDELSGEIELNDWFNLSVEEGWLKLQPHPKKRKPQPPPRSKTTYAENPKEKSIFD